jgi:lipopolysaccharide transport system permease protein
MGRVSNPATPSRVHILEAPGRWSALDLGELWHYRDLLYILAWRDVKVRYKQAILGAAWAVVQPLVMMGVFTLLFSKIADVPTDGVPYPIFAFAALVPWTLFASGAAGSGASLVGNYNLVSKVYFPRLVIPASAILAWVPDFVISSILLFALMAAFGFVPPLTVLLLPLVLVAAMLAAFSVGVWLSALNVAYRDVQYVVPFLIQAWLFLTPVAYPTSAIPEGLRWITGLNPMTWVIDLARWALLGTSASSGIDSISVVTTLVLLTSGLFYFRRVEHFFADVI